VGEHVQVSKSVHVRLMHACMCFDLAEKWLVNKLNRWRCWDVLGWVENFIELGILSYTGVYHHIV
jgi:hypothetical protein